MLLILLMRQLNLFAAAADVAVDAMKMMAMTLWLLFHLFGNVLFHCFDLEQLK